MSKDANLAARFLLEVATLAALFHWGYRAGDGTAARWALALGAPLLAALVWGAFVAPKARWPLPMPWRLVPELAVFSSGVVALAAAGSPVLAVALAAAVLLNEVLLSVWGQR